MQIRIYAAGLAALEAIQVKDTRTVKHAHPGRAAAVDNYTIHETYGKSMRVGIAVFNSAIEFSGMGRVEVAECDICGQLYFCRISD